MTAMAINEKSWVEFMKAGFTLFQKGKYEEENQRIPLKGDSVPVSLLT